MSSIDGASYGRQDFASDPFATDPYAAEPATSWNDEQDPAGVSTEEDSGGGWADGFTTDIFEDDWDTGGADSDAYMPADSAQSDPFLGEPETWPLMAVSEPISPQEAAVADAVYESLTADDPQRWWDSGIVNERLDLGMSVKVDEQLDELTPAGFDDVVGRMTEDELGPLIASVVMPSADVESGIAADFLRLAGATDGGTVDKLIDSGERFMATLGRTDSYRQEGERVEELVGHLQELRDEMPAYRAYGRGPERLWSEVEPLTEEDVSGPSRFAELGLQDADRRDAMRLAGALRPGEKVSLQGSASAAAGNDYGNIGLQLQRSLELEREAGSPDRVRVTVGTTGGLTGSLSTPWLSLGAGRQDGTAESYELDLSRADHRALLSEIANGTANDSRLAGVRVESSEIAGVEGAAEGELSVLGAAATDGHALTTARRRDPGDPGRWQQVVTWETGGGAETSVSYPGLGGLTHTEGLVAGAHRSGISVAYDESGRPRRAEINLVSLEPAGNGMYREVTRRLAVDDAEILERVVARGGGMRSADSFFGADGYRSWDIRGGSGSGAAQAGTVLEGMRQDLLREYLFGGQWQSETDVRLLEARDHQVSAEPVTAGRTAVLSRPRTRASR
ncbi:MAG: hypothetical protein HYV63_06440 [Candidatus Schekmanbacteria bacterium]|nr:hypothetical protein [Candidatus Schekmanbacteria bacterium]